MEQPVFRRGRGNCLYVAAQDGYVNLGFYEGARLDDPMGLLEGTGEAMRHIKIRSVDDLDDPEDGVDTAADHPAQRHRDGAAQPQLLTHLFGIGR